MNHADRDRQYHDAIAPQYDHVVTRPRAFPNSLLFEPFDALFGRRESLLDLGCGTGQMLLRYARAFRSVVGVDHSAGMLLQARANLRKTGLEQVVLLRDDLFAFCTRALSTFDAITCVGAMHHLTTPGRQLLLKQMFNLCAPGGRILVAEPVRAGPAPAAVDDWNRRALGAVRQFSGTLPPDPREAPLDEAEWRAEIEATGFQVACENRMWELSSSRESPHADERERLRRLVEQNPGGNVLALLLERRERVPDWLIAVNDKDAILSRASELEPSAPVDAAQLYAHVMALDPANLTANNALERLQAPSRYSQWMHVNCVIDPRDDIFRFFAGHPLARNPIREYLSDGWRTMSEVTLLLERLNRPLLAMDSVLEFAAGFGRFTRHLARAMPGRITCADVVPGSAEFLREQFGVKAFYSSTNVDEVALPGTYDLIIVLSLFTHLPVERWSAWIARLHAGLKPEGLLVFTVHNEQEAQAHGVRFDRRGTYFVPHSESGQLTGLDYGTTYTTDTFVSTQVELAVGRKPMLHEHLTFWRGQDAVVVPA